MANTVWTIPVVDALRIKGKPANWFPSAASLVASGVPVTVARRWVTVRRSMTVGLRRRIKETRN